MTQFLEITLDLLVGFVETLKIFLVTLALSLPLGLIISFGSMSKFKPLSALTRGFVWIIRGTPLMLQIIVAYYAVPMLKQNDKLPEFIQSFLSGINIQDDNFMFNAIIVAFSLNYAAYFAEIFRGGIESIPKGQYEASAALSMTKTQTFFHIILPQVVKRVVPASSNEVITLIKDTSLANVIAFAEITLKAKQQMQTYSSLTPLFIAGLFYFVLAMILTVISAAIEKKLDYYK